MKPSHVLLVVGAVALLSLYLLTQGDVRTPGQILGGVVQQPGRIPVDFFTGGRPATVNGKAAPLS